MTDSIINENQDLKFDIANMSVERVNFKKDEYSDEENDRERMIKCKLKPTSLHVVQVNEFELEKFARSNLVNREVANRLDLAESLSELLVSAALIAGSNDNITVNCVLLPGSIVT